MDLSKLDDIDKYRITGDDARKSSQGLDGDGPYDMEKINFKIQMRSTYLAIRQALELGQRSATIQINAIQPGGSLVNPLRMANNVKSQLEADGHYVSKMGPWELLVIFDDSFKPVSDPKPPQLPPIIKKKRIVKKKPITPKKTKPKPKLKSKSTKTSQTTKKDNNTFKTKTVIDL